MSPEDLVKALRVLPPVSDPRLLVGTTTLDDAGVVKLSDELALVQTVDFFPPIVDDPEYYGRIAAANALSDVYAMGGQPLCVLSIVGWPKELDPEILGRVLLGGQEKIDEAGALLAGGHTVTDTEIKYGLACTGTVHPDRILTNSSAQAGEMLVLTKPVGMGPVSTGIKKREVGPELAQRAMEQMATLNRSAAEALLAAGVRAVTDITGFGLCGHAKEMADGSDVTLEIDAARVPAFESAEDLISQGILSGGAKRTRAYLGEQLEIGSGVGEIRTKLCLDAETSGGLLAAVPEDRVDALLADLRARGTPCAEVIGRVVPRNSARVRLV